ncbi:PREDICTED: MIT domain-containing protein 1-like [Ceratosolen solmsi marchali]|uniref:MIT domain-containing protein 1-like n=1 Tax=Ceratosolen solmsi marchali TaxID=326594 RepID=A0AAJ6YPT0_9HYME|nr:PREDICTED: MIT domain-containing protein 1-like [Ceratosolen solmsi marchali]
MESVAESIIQRAIDKEKKEQYTMALVLYQEGLQMLIDAIKELKDPVRKVSFQNNAKEYMERAERVKALIEKKKLSGKYREHIKIESNATGYGYSSVFGRFLDGRVTQICVEEPYIRTYHQCQNFLRFCELAVQKCQSLSKISLTTTSEKNKKSEQLEWLEQLKTSLADHLVTLDVQFSETLHDRQISLNNGWIIKIGRGLDYFKPPFSKFVLGYFDLELRPCLETKVDIFHQSQIEDNKK